MGQIPGPSYPFQWPDSPPAAEDAPRERPMWWRWLLLACVALLLVVLIGIVASGIVALS
jgi:hypothetical protein